MGDSDSPMLFNPLIHLGLALLAGVLGYIVLINTESWLSVMPCLFFIATFLVSLVFPEIASFARNRAASQRQARTNVPIRQVQIMDGTSTKQSTSPFTHFERLTSSSLRSHSRPPQGPRAVEREDTPVIQTAVQ